MNRSEGEIIVGPPKKNSLDPLLRDPVSFQEERGEKGWQ